MNPNLTPKDHEALSAYLDDQLAGPEKSRLEGRLQQEPALQEALQGLAQTRHALRMAPRVPAPRNFALTPEMAAGRQSRAFSFARLAFGLATVMLVFSLAGNFVFSQPVENFALQAEPAALSESVEIEEEAEAVMEDAAGGEAAAMEDADQAVIGEAEAAAEEMGAVEEVESLQEAPVEGEAASGVAETEMMPMIEAEEDGAETQGGMILETQEIAVSPTPADLERSTIETAEEAGLPEAQVEGEAAVGPGEAELLENPGPAEEIPPGFLPVPEAVHIDTPPNYWLAAVIVFGALTIASGIFMLFLKK